MWALRRASSNSLKFQAVNVGAFRACAGSGPLTRHSEDNSSSPGQLHCFTQDRWIGSKICYCASYVPNNFSFGHRWLSSQAGAKSGGEEVDELEDGFSELEGPEASEINEEVSVDSSSSSDSESDLSSAKDSLETELLGDLEVDAGKKESKQAQSSSPLLMLLLKEPLQSISGALDKFAENNEISRPDVYKVLTSLRNRKNFRKALQLYEWLEKRDGFDFTVRDYASKVDLVAKVFGTKEAENYIDKLPEDFKEEPVYRTLLANYVSATNVKKSEELFNKMRDLGFKITTFTCNQLLLLYKRTDKTKISDILELMERENLQLSQISYQILIDTKGQSGNMEAMELIVRTMKDNGVEPNTRVKATLARHYAAAGAKEKAEEILKEMEGEDLTRNRYLCKVLLPLYADLGKVEEVERIWKIAESNPREADYFAAIVAFGKLKNVDKADAVFEKMGNSSKKLTAKHYTVMLRVYAENKMLSKGKELVKKMEASGCHIGPLAWDSLVRLYVEAGEVEKADSILQGAMKEKNFRPLFSSYIAMMDEYAKRGDIHNAEKTFLRMRQAGYVARARAFHALLRTYINAKKPAYGIRERMKADNIYPSKSLVEQISQVDAFRIRKTPLSELLD